MDILPAYACSFHYTLIAAGMYGYVKEAIMKIFEFVKVKIRCTGKVV